jgi:RNA polymerase sigma-54 factor
VANKIIKLRFFAPLRQKTKKMLKQFLNLKLSQKLSPQQIQLMKLIQLPTQAFEQRLLEEMNENPALEAGKEEEEYAKDEFETEDYDDYDDAESERIDAEEINIDDYLSNDETPDYKTQTNNYSDDDEDHDAPFAAPISFHQDLINQLNTFILTEADREIAEFLVGSIDDMGYIRRSISDIVDDLAFTQAVYTDEKTVERLLHVIHELEPSGVGARDLQECLLLQLKHKTPTEYVELATDIIENQFDAFTKKHYDKLLQKYNVSNEQLKKAVHEIEKLNPKPGGSFTGNNKITENVVPDFAIRIVEGKLELSLNGRNAPSLHVSRDYQEMLQTYKVSKDKSNQQKEAVQFIKQKLDSAKWFIDAIRQRQETLFVTMNAIMQYQEEFFLEGDETKLKPMILKDIADLVGLDISTISRVANSKYVETPYGTKLIKEFFSEAMKNDQGEDVSTLEIKKILQNVIEEEDKHKPLPDDQLADILKEKGYPIARRTIAKYREQLDIPVARMRKKM